MGLWDRTPELATVLPSAQPLLSAAVIDAVAVGLRPSFFVIGPPRTGTSWLHEVLREHALLPRLSKETRFFDTHFHRGIKWYHAHYPKPAPGRCVGEVAPTYFASTHARERIVRLNPQARVICTFRHPVERVLSLYRVKRAYGMIPWSFEEAITRDPELTDSGRYATHLKAWQCAFGRDRVLVTLYDDLRDQPQSYIDVLADFIGVARFSLTPSQIQRVYASDHMTHPRNYFRTWGATAVANWCKARRLDRIVTAVKRSPMLKLFVGGGPPFAELSSDLSHKLYELFRPEVEQLEALLNRDFSAWKCPQHSLQVSASSSG
jgi:hypothetical protein